MLTLPSNVLIDKIAIYDLDLLFEGQTLKMFISERVNGRAKMCGRHL